MTTDFNVAALRRSMIHARRSRGITRQRLADELTSHLGRPIIDSMVAAWEDRVAPPRFVVDFYTQRFGRLVDPAGNAARSDVTRGTRNVPLDVEAVRLAAKERRHTAGDLAELLAAPVSFVADIVDSDDPVQMVTHGAWMALGDALGVPPVKLRSCPAPDPEPAPARLLKAARAAADATPAYTFADLAFDCDLTIDDVTAALTGRPNNPEHPARLAVALRIPAPNRNRLTLNEDTVRRFVADGVAFEDVVDRTGSSEKAVIAAFRRYGFDAPARRGRWTREEMAALVDEGLTNSQIAERLDTNTRAVSYWLRFHGLTGFQMSAEWLQERLAESMTITQIAEAAGVTRAAVYNNLKKHRIPIPADSRRAA